MKFFTPGKCMVCETDIPLNKLYCPKCEPRPMPRNHNQSLIHGHYHNVDFGENRQIIPRSNKDWDVIGNLDTGQIGYIMPSALFETDGLLWILSSTEVTFIQDIYHTVRVRKNKNGAIEAIFSDVDRDAISFGWPDESNNIPTFIVQLTNNFHD